MKYFLLRCSAAAVLGWVFQKIFYSAAPSQWKKVADSSPVLGALFGWVVTLMAVLVYGVLRRTPFDSIWNKSARLPFILFGLSIIFFSADFATRRTYFDFDYPLELAAVFIAVFCVANWPLSEK